MGCANHAFANESEIVSFNKATVEQLMAIEDVETPGKLAKAIVAYREKNGSFKYPTGLGQVPRMTNYMLEDLNPVETEDGDDIVFCPCCLRT